MSGIGGIWHRGGRPLEPADLTRMSATLAHRGADAAATWLDGPVGLACRQRRVTREELEERQPLAGPAGVVLVWDGRLDNRDELLTVLAASPDASDAALVLSAYQRWRQDCARHLNGDFAFAVYDLGVPALLLARDAMGVRPLYYAHGPDGRFAFASEIKALLSLPGVRAEPDLEGLADFLLLGQRPLEQQDRTCVAGIVALPPAHRAVITPDRVDVRRYWDFDTGRSIRLRSPADYVDAFRDHFATAVRRRGRSACPVAVSVSGGLDSSSVLSQLETDRRGGRADCPGVVGVSYVGAAGTDADERRYLEDLEAHHALTITRIPLERFQGVLRGAEDQVRAIEAPLMDFMWGVTEATFRAAGAAGAKVMLSGHWGDQMLFTPAYLVDLFARGRWVDIWRHTAVIGAYGLGQAATWRRRLALDVIRQYTPAALVPPLKWLRRRLPGVAPSKAWFAPAFRRLALRGANRPATLGDGFHSATARAVYLQARSKYHVHCMELNNKAAAWFGLDMAFPFLDRDLVAFLMAIPGEVQCRGGVPRWLLREAMRGVLPEPVRARTWKADFTEVTNRGVARDLGEIATRLSGDSRAARVGILDPRRLVAEIPRLAAALQSPDAVASWALADLFGLETWVAVFLDAGRAGSGPETPGLVPDNRRTA